MITLHFIYNRSTNMNYFIYTSQSSVSLQQVHHVIVTANYYDDCKVTQTRIYWTSAGCFFVHLLLSKGLPFHQCLKISITFTFTVSARRAVLNYTANLLWSISEPVWRSSLSLFILSEALFGMAPFASGSFAELEKKIRSSDPITVRYWFCSQLCYGIY